MIKKCKKVNHKRNNRLETNRQISIMHRQTKNNFISSTGNQMKIIKQFIITIVINGLVLYSISNYLPQLWFSVQSEYSDTMIVFATLGIAFWITNSLLKKALKIITLPIKYLTMGISGIVINIVLLYFFEQMMNYLDIWVKVSLWTFVQTCILSIIFTSIHFIIKKI